jgi:hypothetical protein
MTLHDELRIKSIQAAGEWRIIADYLNYAVSSDGRIYSFIKNRELKSTQDKGTNYICVSLMNERGRRNHTIHRLVCTAFNDGRSETNKLVLHKNGIRTDNRAENLYWGTYSNNANDCVRHGTHKHNFPSPLAKAFALRGTYRARSGRYIARCKYRGKQITVGTFDTEYKAFMARIQFLIKISGAVE